MDSPQPKRYIQFSMRFLLAIVTLIAVLMVPISRYYHSVSQRPDSWESAWLESGSQNDLPSNFIANIDPSSLYQQLLDEPRIRDLPSILNTTDPKSWLSQHLSIRIPENQSYVEITAHGRSEHVETSDLRKIVETTIDVIRENATKTDTRITVFSRSTASTAR